MVDAAAEMETVAETDIIAEMVTVAEMETVAETEILAEGAAENKILVKKNTSDEYFPFTSHSRHLIINS